MDVFLTGQCMMFISHFDLSRQISVLCALHGILEAVCTVCLESRFFHVAEVSGESYLVMGLQCINI